MDLGELDLARPAGQELDDRNVVNRRVGIGERDHRRHPAGRGGLPAALDRFHVLGAGLAQLHTHIDEAGSQAQPLGHHRLEIPLAGGESSTDRPDSFALEEQVADRVEPALGIEQPGAANQHTGSARCGGVHGSGGPLPRSRVRISRQAMRTATPIST